jgi:hypothetical protein
MGTFLKSFDKMQGLRLTSEGRGPYGPAQTQRTVFTFSFRASFRTSHRLLFFMI